jgi:hypothetical protein
MKKVLDRILHLVLHVRIVRPVDDFVLLNEGIYTQGRFSRPFDVKGSGLISRYLLRVVPSTKYFI